MHTELDRSTSDAQAPDCVDRLRRLPDEIPPPYDWREFQRRSRQRSAGLPARLGRLVSSDRLDWRHAAIAAVVVLVGSIALWIGTVSPPAAGANDPRERSLVAQEDPVAQEDIPPDPLADPVERSTPSAVARSRAIENWLSSLPLEPTVVRVGTRAAAVDLEDQIAQVDELLTSVRLDGAQPDRLSVLQLERVRLVGSLAQVRYAEVVAAE